VTRRRQLPPPMLRYDRTGANGSERGYVLPRD
jgi:hypothetical protein